MALNLDNLTNIDQVIGALEHEFQGYLDAGEIDKSLILAPQITLLLVMKRELDKKVDRVDIGQYISNGNFASGPMRRGYCDVCKEDTTLPHGHIS